MKASAVGLSRQALRGASSKVLPQVDKRERSLGASGVLDVPDPCVERQVLRHIVVGEEIEEIEPGAPRLVLRELEKGSSKSAPAMVGMNRDVVDQEPFVGDGEDDDPHDGAVAFGDGYLAVADDLGIVVGHRARQHSDTLDVVPIRGINKFSHARSIRCVRRPKRIGPRLLM